MFRKCLVLAALVCGPFVLWTANTSAQDLIESASNDVITLDTDLVFHPSLFLVDVPVGFTIAEPVSTEPSTWGKVKVEVGKPGDEREGLPGLQLVRGARFAVGWPFREDPTGWTYWDASRTDYWTHHGADYYALDLSRAGCTGVPVHAGIAGRVYVRQNVWGYGNTIVVYDPSRHVAVRYAHLQSTESFGWGSWIAFGTRLGTVGATDGGSRLVTGPHLHICAYENINDNGGNPIIPTSGDSEYYCCAMAFYCW